MRENQVGTEIEGGIMIIGVEIMTGIVIKNVIGIMTALRLMILEVAIGHILGLGNAPRIMIATGMTDTRCCEEENEYETVLA
ncbi:hypothetical protein SLEP1_g51951 [Rubroshorea leprosula]|uniref:Uncharacterized protein n=1 Tax=Rubroshorea leprosula TaxID=152421 RepID=A0AAV5M855_9ROSI|nr:hypothetical protein SLEP1_g51951 [Rubroshorea leprosula]